jgi:hypothetical protein
VGETESSTDALAGCLRAYQHHQPSTTEEVVMAKGQMRVPKEKKKPKADKDKPKQMSAYKLSQMQGPAGKK